MIWGGRNHCVWEPTETGVVDLVSFGQFQGASFPG